MHRVINGLQFILFAFIINTPLHAQCVVGDCSDGNGTYLYPSGAKYIGSFQNHKAHGVGKLLFINGDIYDGEWNMHVRQGRGRLISKNNFEYVGDFSANQFHGKGKITFNNNDIYDGAFVKGVFHGAGTYISSNGDRVTGEWVEGEPVNRKVDVAATSNVNTSSSALTKSSEHLKNCNEHKCHEESGRYIYRDGTIFTGAFVNGEPEGEGVVEYVNGDVYRGGWKKHAPNGVGVVQYANGRTYGAHWDNGKPINELQADHPMVKEMVDVDKDDETKIWAVIIGVSRYNHMPTLRYTDDDAFHLYAFLKSPEGGALPDDQISLLIDEQANRRDIIRELQKTFYRADENDVVMLYYSGHGLQGRMIPSDFDGYNNAVKYDELKNIVKQSRAKHKIVITDACHSGSLLASRSPLNFQLNGFYQQLSEADDGIAFITSSKGEEVSMESSGLRHGIFSHFLIQGLQGQADKNADLNVTISELYEYVQAEVQDYTKMAQNPLIFGQYDPDMPIAFVRE